MKYYLIKYKNGLFAYKEDEKYSILIVRIEVFKPSDDDFFNIYYVYGSVKYFTAKRGLVLFESENLDEIVERAAIEAL